MGRRMRPVLGWFVCLLDEDFVALGEMGEGHSTAIGQRVIALSPTLTVPYHLSCSLNGKLETRRGDRADFKEV